MPTFCVREDLHLLRHPFYRAWMEGTLSADALRDYAGQYYHHVAAFPGYLQQALAQGPSPAAAAVLAENLAEEDGTAYGTSHPELWLRFAEGVGNPRGAVLAAEKRTGIRNVVSTFRELSGRSLASALGCLYAYESQVPEVAASKIEGLKKHFAIHDARTLSFFEVHKTADVAHRESLLALLTDLPPAERAEAELAAEAGAQALWDFLSGIPVTGLAA